MMCIASANLGYVVRQQWPGLQHGSKGCKTIATFATLCNRPGQTTVASNRLTTKCNLLWALLPECADMLLQFPQPEGDHDY